MSKVDEPELFFCWLCKKPVPINLMKEISVKGSWHKKEICEECMKRINSVADVSVTTKDKRSMD